MTRAKCAAPIAATAALYAPQLVAQRDVAPHPADTAALPDVGDAWLTENSYSAGAIGEGSWRAAVDIGALDYNQNCARTRGPELVSGTPLAGGVAWRPSSQIDGTPEACMATADTRTVDLWAAH